MPRSPLTLEVKEQKIRDGKKARGEEKDGKGEVSREVVRALVILVMWEWDSHKSKLQTQQH